MGNKKKFVILAMAVFLSAGLNSAIADSVSLTQMDIKKSSVADTVDVTFYTTGNNSNTVVTRKGTNRYVVLLPNVMSSSSVAPALGGVKDLVTDIDVKHVDDGIGGYTKVTFSTTKPITIKTFNKKANPLTQAQKDTKAIIAQNNTKPAVATTKPQTTATQAKPQSTQAKPAESKPETAQKPQAKVVEQPKVNKTASAPKIVPIEVPKPKLQPISFKKETPVSKVQPKKIEPKIEVKSQEKVASAPKVQNNSGDFLSSNYQPKMKFDENGKRMMDLEPHVSHEIIANNKTNTKETSLTDTEQPQNQVVPAVDNTATAVETPGTNENKTSRFPLWILISGAIAGIFGIMYLVFDALVHKSKKDASRLESFFNISAKNHTKRRNREYYDIVNNDDLNWQEKYKLYTEKEEQRNPKPQSTQISFVTDLSGTKKTVVMPEIKQEESKEKLANTIKKPEKSHDELVREKLQAKISQMEHSLAQTPSLQEPEEISNEVKSEDDSIMNKFSEIKLKSFAKPVSLRETHRTLAEEDKKISRNKSYKEGRFVKLKNSPLSVTRRQSASSALNPSDLISTGSKYLTNENNGEMKMNKENENYLLSSVNEYLSILDTEETRRSQMTVADSLSQMQPKSSEIMNRSGMTNPISGMPRTSTHKPMPLNGGLVVKSGYNIDAQRGFYLVNIDGVSALVGRIKDDIFILKKFNHVIDKPLQVRPDDNNVYIVRVGKFKCLVDVAADKMGTLIEI